MELYPETFYNVRMNQREFNLMTRAIGAASGADVSFKDTEADELRELNEALLRQQASHLRQQAEQAVAKLKKVGAE